MIPWILISLAALIVGATEVLIRRRPKTDWRNTSLNRLAARIVAGVLGVVGVGWALFT